MNFGEIEYEGLGDVVFMQHCQRMRYNAPLLVRDWRVRGIGLYASTAYDTVTLPARHGAAGMRVDIYSTSRGNRVHLPNSTVCQYAM